MITKQAAATAEIHFTSWSGYLMLLVGLLVMAAGVASWVHGAHLGAVDPGSALKAVACFVLGAFVLKGLYLVQPRQAALLLLFGAYKGTDRVSGLRWANPLLKKTRLSLRAHNLNSEKIKVNDKRGNPIEIAAAVVWRVSDTARASFDVEKYEEYVKVQGETAIRHIASKYAYDDHEEMPAGQHEITLRSGLDEVGVSLLHELQARFEPAGIVVEDARLIHLAYAPEIAGVMLRRQQAEAVIAARQKIVTGAVSMVEMALKALSERQVVHLDDERKAAMVSNLLVVLCAESDVQPVVNAGTLYS